MAEWRPQNPERLGVPVGVLGERRRLEEDSVGFVDHGDDVSLPYHINAHEAHLHPSDGADREPRSRRSCSRCPREDTRGASRYRPSLEHLFDKLGTGLSDRVPLHELPTLEHRMDDARAVMEAAASERATLFGDSEGGAMCILIAATYPQRTSALILYGTYAKRLNPNDDYPWAMSSSDRQALIERIHRMWATDEFVQGVLETMSPSGAEDPAFRRWLSAYYRNGASPAAAAAYRR